MEVARVGGIRVIGNSFKLVGHGHGIVRGNFYNLDENQVIVAGGPTVVAPRQIFDPAIVRASYACAGIVGESAAEFSGPVRRPHVP